MVSGVACCAPCTDLFSVTDEESMLANFGKLCEIHEIGSNIDT